MTEIQTHAIILALRSAFNGRSFNICGVSDACDVAGIADYRRHAHWPTLHAFHCKSWDDIGPHRMGVLRMVFDILGVTFPFVLGPGALNDVQTDDDYEAMV